MLVRAKFTCTKNEIVSSQADQASITLTPVTDGSAENKSFFTYTPGGSINLQVVNPSAAEQFFVGKSYYVDFTPAE